MPDDAPVTSAVLITFSPATLGWTALNRPTGVKT
jgi:hypothetical protein